MKAYGIPLGIYWVDRPWGPGVNGYDDFEIDTNRLPNFAESVKWLNGQKVQMILWIGPFFNGQMATNALAQGWTLASASQKPSKVNYPLVDFTNPEAKKYWQDGVAKLLKLGVAGFKMDRAEEEIPESGPYRVFDGRSVRENRNAYPVMYLQAAYGVAREYRSNEDFVCMPRAAYTGSAADGVFWGGDIGGTEHGLRAEIIAVQRAAVMGYPNWGSDTGGYNQQSMDTEVVGRWLGFSCFTPIMEVGPTRNRAFWNFHNPPGYDAELIAIWRLYARLHTRLAGYSFEQAKTAHETGMPIVRPLFLVEPKAPAAWSNWWTYLYGPDLLVSPVRQPVAGCVAPRENLSRRPDHHRQRRFAPNADFRPGRLEARPRRFEPGMDRCGGRREHAPGFKAARCRIEGVVREGISGQSIRSRIIPTRRTPSFYFKASLSAKTSAPGFFAGSVTCRPSASRVQVIFFDEPSNWTEAMAWSRSAGWPAVPWPRLWMTSLPSSGQPRK
jgi:hypothetical protein